MERGCALVLQRDLQYWGVDDMSMEPCCALKYFPELEVCQSEKDGDLDAKKRAMEQAEEEDFGNTKCGQWRAWVWSTIGRQYSIFISSNIIVQLFFSTAMLH